MYTFKIKLIFIISFIFFTFFACNQKTHLNRITLAWENNISNDTNNYQTYLKNYKIKKTFLPYAKFPNGFMFLNNSGKTIYTFKRETENQHYSVSRNYYVTYHQKTVKKNRFKGNIVRFFSNTGASIKVRKRKLYREKHPIPLNCIKTKATPRISPEGSLIALFDSAGVNFEIYNNKGKQLISSRTYGPLITSYSFSRKNDYFAVGYLNGAFAVFNNKGKELFNKKVKVGKYHVIKSVFVSDDGQYIGIVAGIYPEYVLVFNRKGKLLWYNTTGVNQRKRVFACFTQGKAKRVVVGIPGGAAIYNNPDGEFINKVQFFRNNTEHFFLFDADGAENGNIALSFSLKKSTYIQLVSSKGLPTKQIHFPDSFMYLRFANKGKTLFMQGNKNILCYDIARED